MLESQLPNKKDLLSKRQTISKTGWFVSYLPMKIRTLLVPFVLFVILVPFVSGGNIPISSDRPNIVVVLTDDQSFESLRVMPFMSTRNWLTFENAYTNVALCCPSRAAILSGLYSHNSGVEHNGLGYLHNDATDIAARLRSVGYTTAYYGKYLNKFPFNGKLFSPQGWLDWGVFYKQPGYYNYTLMNKADLLKYGDSAPNYSTNVLSGMTVDFVETAPEPFFVFFAPYAPHAPFTPANKYTDTDFGTMPRYPNHNEADVSDKPQWVQNLPMLNDASVDQTRLQQYRTLLSVDDSVQKIIDAAKQRGVYENTIVIYMSDNGYSLGAHRFMNKICEYDECIHIPLLIRHPNFSGHVVSQMVSNVDVAATIADFANAPGDGFDGNSFVPLIENSGTSWNNDVLIRWVGEPSQSTIPGFWGIRTPEWKYVELATGEKELYNLVNDPYEMDNLYGDPQYNGVVEDLKQRLESMNGSLP